MISLTLVERRVVVQDGSKSNRLIRRRRLEQSVLEAQACRAIEGIRVHLDVAVLHPAPIVGCVTEAAEVAAVDADPVVHQTANFLARELLHVLATEQVCAMPPFAPGLRCGVGLGAASATRLAWTHSLCPCAAPVD